VSVPKFENLKFKKQYRKTLKPSKAKEATGLDCEVGVDGYAFLIADDLGDFRRIGSFDDVLSFLTRKRFRGKLNCFYNLKYDLGCLVKYLGRDKCFELVKQCKTEYKGWTIVYIPQKVLKLKKGHKTYQFFDIAQFFGYMELAEAARTYLGEEKLEMETKEFTRNFVNANFTRIVDYCQQDAKLTQKLAEFTLKAYRSLGVEPKDLVSPASIAQRYFRLSGWMPKVNELPYRALEFAYNCYKGGWFEVFKRGYFPEIYQYDVNSAYPAEIAELLDIERGDWVKRDEYLPKCPYGYIRAWVEIDFKGISPIGVSTKWGNYYPQGSFETYITKQEFDFINEHLGKAQILEAWWFIPWEYSYPFRKTVRKLFELKQKAEQEGDEYTYFAAKLLMNSFYGKFFQKTPRSGEIQTGQLFNPIYATEITARARLKVAKAMLEHQREIAMVATDSIFATRSINLDGGDKLGGFKLVEQGEALIIGSGVYTIRNGKVKSRFRGLKTTSKIDWFEILEDEARNGDGVILTIKTKKAATLGEALATDFERLGRFEEQEKKLSLNFDHKRAWFREFERASDALKEQIPSAPLPYLLL